MDLLAATAALFIIMSAGCGSDDGATSGTAASVTEGARADEAAEQAETEAVETPTDVEPPDDVGPCGIAGASEADRVGCASDADCALTSIDHRSCSRDVCGGARHAYNCDFARRLSRECEASDCAQRGAGVVNVQCGRGGSPGFESYCDAGRCAARVATRHALSRLLGVQGELPERDARRAVRRQLREVETCFPARNVGPFDEAPEDVPEDAAEFVFAMVVAPSGAVTEVSQLSQLSDEGPSPRGGSVAACIGERLRSVVFPVSPGQAPSRVVHTFARRAERRGCDGARR